MKIVGVIPARYGSSRFQGKPLADIHGKPMIWWVYNNAINTPELDEVYVATESEIIINECNKWGINAILTADTHLTGTDRVGEVASKINADIYVVLMGDEPLIKSDEISKVIKEMKKDRSISACMLATKFKNPVDVVNTTTIKLAINKENNLLFMSRSPIPFPKESLNFEYYKNMGLYAYTSDVLKFFVETEAGPIESAEGLEMLRLIENRKRVKIVKVNSNSMSVDTPKDLDRIRKILSKEK